MKRLSAVSSCALLLIAMAASPAEAALAAPACTIAAPQAQGLDATADAEGVPRYQKWLDTVAGNRINRAVQKRTDRMFGITSAKLTVADLLRRGLIGHAYNHKTKTVVTVVTPEYSQAAVLRSQLEETAEPSGPNASVLVGCHSASELIAAHDLMFARAWHPDAAAASFTFSLDPATSQYEVNFDERYPEAGKALEAAVGDLVRLTYGTSGRAGRLDDGSPHFGGAGIRDGAGTASSNKCTSGFTARRNSDGQRGSFTAGHCFANNRSIYSGPKYYGYSWGKVNYPAYDIIGIRSTTESYQNVIHVDPCCPNTRSVIGTKNLIVGDTFCSSGMTTRAICGLIVYSLNASICDLDGCTYGLIQYHKSGAVVARVGDSGGPLYVQSGSSGARASGIIVGYGNGGTIALAEKISGIQSYLGVSVLTS